MDGEKKADKKGRKTEEKMFGNSKVGNSNVRENANEIPFGVIINSISCFYNIVNGLP